MISGWWQAELMLTDERARAVGTMVAAGEVSDFLK